MAYPVQYTYIYRGKRMAAGEIAALPACVVSFDCLRGRLKRGWDVQLAMKTPPAHRRPPATLTAWGEEKTLEEWSRDPRCSVDARTLRERIHSSSFLTPEEVIQTPPYGKLPPPAPRHPELRKSTIRNRRRQGRSLLDPPMPPLHGDSRQQRIEEAWAEFEAAGKPLLELQGGRKSTKTQLPRSLADKLQPSADALCVSVSVFASMLLVWWFGSDDPRQKQH